MKATLTFKDIKSAKEFVIKWGSATLTGHCMSAVKENGSVDVTVYDVDAQKKQFIENYILNELAKEA